MSDPAKPAMHDVPGGTLLDQVHASGGIRMENMRYLTDLSGPMPVAPPVRRPGFYDGFAAAVDAARDRLASAGIDPQVLDGLTD